MPISFRHMCSLEISLDQSTVAISGNYLEHHNAELFFVFVCCFDATAVIRTQKLDRQVATNPVCVWHRRS